MEKLLRILIIEDHPDAAANLGDYLAELQKGDPGGSTN